MESNPTYVYVSVFVDELRRVGVRHVVICPGSRSTPLAVVFAAQPGIRAWMHIDERSAAYFALGMARRLERPVAILCTSGTAAANFLPAIVEANLAHIPLLVLTADRPPELQNNGAPQSIDQRRLYGTHAKWFVDVALPEASNTALRFIRTLAQRATALALAAPAGAVHLNFALREPLTPDALPDQPLPPLAQRDLIAWQGRPNDTPYIEVTTAPLSAPSVVQLADMAHTLKQVERGLIIAGPQNNAALGELLLRLAQRLNYPILADPLSQLRGCDSELVLCSYDAFLRSDHFVTQSAPQVILRFGAMPTSKPLLLFLKRHPSCPQMVIDGNAAWEEPTLLASQLLQTDPLVFCDHLLNAFEESDLPANTLAPSGQSWLALWQRAEQRTRRALQAAMLDFPALFEGRVFLELANALPDGATLYLGNSMPVRDADTFFWPWRRRLRMMGNRGTNGIDGVISSALGASAANQENPVVLVIGDLSFFHDQNGLLAARLHQLDLTVVLVNNDGGGIFSFLPQAAHEEYFEQLFGTPTGLDFSPIVQMYGGTFQRVENWEHFNKALSRGLTGGGLRVIEVATERASNVHMHRQLWQEVDQALRDL